MAFIMGALLSLSCIGIGYMIGYADAVMDRVKERE